VKKVEALGSHVRRSQEALEEVPKLIEQFRQSVLAAAFRGDLTADWRKQNPDVEPASVLLERIKNLSKIKPDSEIFERSSSFSIPDSWKWIELGKIGNFVGGGTPSKRNPDFWIGSIPWISPKDMKVNKISFGKDFISEEAVGSSSVKMIPTKSILFVVRGMILNHSFPVAITENQVTINQDMKALVPHDEVMSDYIFYFSLFMGKRILFKVKAATHGTRRLESYILENWAIPIPPIQEQLKIVDKLKDYFCKIDFLKEQLHFSHTELAVMDQSILAKAFRGELVPQDFNDEPASVLLEHIRAEQAQPKSTKKTPTTTGKQKKQTSSQLELDGMNPEIL
jgi:type I restriction enzyme S subunit